MATVTNGLRTSLFLLVALAFPLSVHALEKEYVDKAVPPDARGGLGWDGTLDVGANVNFGSNRSVVGQVDGQSWTLGAAVTGTLEYIKGVHDWRNSGKLLSGFTYGPPINQFVKTSDKIAFQSVYYFHIPAAPWFGPFARFDFESALFEGADYRASPVKWAITRSDGTIREETGKRLKLSESFAPIQLKEALGVFARPVSWEVLEVEARLGVGSSQVFPRGALALNDTAGTDVIEVKTLSQFSQLGAEVGLSLTGKAYDRKVSYAVIAEAMTPFVRQKKAGDDRGAFAMTNVELGAKVSFKLVDWASVDYEFKALRLPQLVDVFQIQNLLLLSFHYSLVKAKAPAEAPAGK